MADDWEKAKRIFADAIKLAPELRLQYVDEVCADDPEMRREVESLLASFDDAESFMKAPAAKEVADLIKSNDKQLKAGTHFGHYEIIEQIGAGGMGEVYLAKDTRLGRQVALKLLSIEVDSDKSKISRFKQEARAASALNHPNILTVYDIGETDSAHFIATEFVNGKTLREYLNGTSLSWQKAVDIIIQVAKALFAAHQVGIVHRDIKPENIMIRNDGYVKVLDFGLAKLTERKFSENSLVITEPGLIMGTPRYMSPEQIRRYEVDERSDIFSLGVVFYEMISGRPPFEGTTVSDVIAAVLQNEPPNISQYASDIPVQIEKILNKALQKERAVRYQTMAEMLLDLERFQQNPAAEIKDHQSVTLQMPAVSGERQTPTAETNPQNNIQTPQDLTDLTTTKDQTLPTQSIFQKYWLYAAATAFALIVLLPLGILYLKLYEAGNNNQSTQSSQPAAKMMTINRVTTNGKATHSAISQDGKYIAYALAESGKQSLWVKHLPTSRNVQIIPPSDSLYGNLTFSADGNYIYYVGKPNFQNLKSEVFVVPVLGGTQKKIAETGTLFALSPDNKQVVISRFSPDQKDISIVTANVEGGEEKTIATGKYDDWGIHAAWSPDGRRIALLSSNVESRDSLFDLIEIQLDTLQKKIISTLPWIFIISLEWIPDGSGLLITATDRPENPAQIWHIAYPGGELRRVTNDLNIYSSVSVSADSKLLVAVQSVKNVGIWIAEKGNLQLSKQITSGIGSEGTAGIVWTPDGKIVYTSLIEGKHDLWIMDDDGSRQTQLTLNSGINVEPSISPDGRYIVFTSNRSGSFHLWRMDIDGNNPVQLTNESGGRLPQFSADGKWIIFQSLESNENGNPVTPAIYKMPADGGTPVQLTESPSWQPIVSPNGKLIAFLTEKELSGIHIDTGERHKILEVPGVTKSWNNMVFLPELTIKMPHFRWLPDGSGFTYVDTSETKQEMWKILLDKKKPEKISELDNIGTYFAWSKDGQKIVYNKIILFKDVVIISNW